MLATNWHFDDRIDVGKFFVNNHFFEAEEVSENSWIKKSNFKKLASLFTIGVTAEMEILKTKLIPQRSCANKKSTRTVHINNRSKSRIVFRNDL